MKERSPREQRRNLEYVRATPPRVSRFGFQKRHEELTEQEKEHGFKPESKAERIAQVMKEAHEKVERKRKRR
jgi:hypothetical protein